MGDFSYNVDMIYFYAICASLLAVVSETMYRKYNLPFFSFSGISFLMFTLPLYIPLSYFIYKTFVGVESFLEGAILFTVGTALCRVLSSLVILHEFPSTRVIIAFGLLLLAEVVRVVKI